MLQPPSPSSYPAGTLQQLDLLPAHPSLIKPAKWLHYFWHYLEDCLYLLGSKMTQLNWWNLKCTHSAFSYPTDRNSGEQAVLQITWLSPHVIFGSWSWRGYTKMECAVVQSSELLKIPERTGHFTWSSQPAVAIEGHSLKLVQERRYWLRRAGTSDVPGQSLLFEQGLWAQDDTPPSPIVNISLLLCKEL